jgi:hypothetical protein
VARHLRYIDIDEKRQEADERERWIIVSDLLDEIAFLPDHLEVKVSVAPRMNVRLPGWDSPEGRRFSVSESLRWIGRTLGGGCGPGGLIPRGRAVFCGRSIPTVADQAVVAGEGDSDSIKPIGLSLRAD